MNILSLFDGMSCGRIALDKAGVNVSKYYASEIDKAAIKVAATNYPNTVHVGAVENWKEWDINWSKIDLLIGGSPCQGFSFAGKQLAFDDPRSALFFVYIDILAHIREKNPNMKFMLENVKMQKKHLDIISENLGVEPMFINSCLVSACERPRYYWFNFSVEPITPVNTVFGDVIDYSLTDNTMSDGWHKWWEKNKDFQIKKKYSRTVWPGQKGITMTARQYASWNGNFVGTPEGKFRKPTKQELALLVGANENYFDSVSQRQAEMLSGNGWTIDVISHIFKTGFARQAA